MTRGTAGIPFLATRRMHAPTANPGRSRILFAGARVSVTRRITAAQRHTAAAAAARQCGGGRCAARGGCAARQMTTKGCGGATTQPHRRNTRAATAATDIISSQLKQPTELQPPWAACPARVTAPSTWFAGLSWRLSVAASESLRRCEGNQPRADEACAALRPPRVPSRAPCTLLLAAACTTWLLPPPRRRRRRESCEVGRASSSIPRQHHLTKRANTADTR